LFDPAVKLQRREGRKDPLVRFAVLTAPYDCARSVGCDELGQGCPPNRIFWRCKLLPNQGQR